MLYNCDFVARHTGLPSQMTNYQQSFHSNLLLLHPIVTGHHTYKQPLEGLCWRRTTMPQKWYMCFCTWIFGMVEKWYNAGLKIALSPGSFLASVQISITTWGRACNHGPCRSTTLPIMECTREVLRSTAQALYIRRKKFCAILHWGLLQDIAKVSYIFIALLISLLAFAHRYTVNLGAQSTSTFIPKQCIFAVSITQGTYQSWGIIPRDQIYSSVNAAVVPMKLLLDCLTSPHLRTNQLPSAVKIWHPCWMKTTMWPAPQSTTHSQSLAQHCWHPNYSQLLWSSISRLLPELQYSCRGV